MSILSAMSRPVTAGLAAALAVAVAAPTLAQSESQPDVEVKTEATQQTKGEKKLAKLLDGRVAGEPQRCIRSLPSQRMQTIDGVAYVYGSGSTIYVQRTSNPENIDDNDALVTRRFSGTELCRLDVTTTVDRVNGFFTGAVFFEDFVPYTRAKSDGSAEG